MEKNKVYVISTKDENILLGIFKMSKAKAKYECWKWWGKEFSLNFIEFLQEIDVARRSDLDVYEFDSVHPNDMFDHWAFEDDENPQWDEIINYFHAEYKEVIGDGN
jgi:hypothetical protein